MNSLRSTSVSIDARRAAEGALKWLLTLVERAEVQAQLPPLLNTLIGCWICEKGLGADSSAGGCKASTGVIQAWFDRHRDETEQFSALLSCDCASVLLAAGIMRALDKASPIIDRFAQLVASGVNEEAGSSNRDGADLFASRFLLSRLRLSPEPKPREYNQIKLTDDVKLFRADADAMRTLADDVAELTIFGASPLKLSHKAATDLYLTMQVLMFSYLRSYNLEIGSLFLRTIRYLVAKGAGDHLEAAQFLLLQQQAVGCFGYLGPEISRIQGTGRAINPDLDIYLPATISCLWSLSEATQTEFVLFRSF